MTGYTADPGGQPVTAPTLPEVAQKRGVQTFLQGLAIDVAVALALVIGTELGGITRWEDFLAPALTLTLTKSVIQAVVAYVVRRFYDSSGFASSGPPVGNSGEATGS